MKSMWWTTGFIVALAAAPAHSAVVEIGLASNFSEISQSSSNPYGDYFRKGVNLAVKDASLRLSKRALQLHFQEFDYGIDQLRAIAAAKAANQSNVIAVLGYNWSSQALIAAPLHQQAGLPMVTPSSTANRLSTMGPYVHMACFDNSFMGLTLARHAIQKLRAKTAAIVVAEDCAYCHDLADGFEAEFLATTGTRPLRFGVTSSQVNFDTLISQITQRPPNVVLVPNYELLSVRIISALTKHGIRGPYLGGDGWGDVGEELFKLLGETRLTAYSVTHWHRDANTPGSASFRQRFVAAYGVEPNDTAVLAYDATNLLIEALLTARTHTREGVEQALSGIRTFNGLTGTFRYGPHGAPAKSIVLLKAGKNQLEFAEVIDPAAPTP